CPYCKKTFNISILVCRQRTCQSERPYKCPKCGKCFSCELSPSRYRLTHTGEKHFSCSHCGESI
ncbi:Zinc finger protein 572, partial [Apaloderma vittatum]